MKKTYISPSIITMRVETINMIATSLDVYSGTANDESLLLGRGRNYDLWDDEEDE